MRYYILEFYAHFLILSFYGTDKFFFVMPLKVANTLIDLYEDCCNDNYEMLEELRATRSQASASVVKVRSF